MKRLLYPVALALLSVQCGQKEELRTALLPADFKALVRFEVGTYWIYQDSATQALDSVWVTRLDEGIGPTREYGEIVNYREGVGVQTQHSRGGLRVYYGSDAACFPDLGNPGGCARLIRRRLLDPDPAGGDAGVQDYALEYPLPAGQEVIFRGGGGLYMYRYAVPLTLGLRSYADVVRGTNPYDESEGNAAVTYYWAPGYGLVRRRIRALNRPVQTWTLVRERIVQ